MVLKQYTECEFFCTPCYYPAPSLSPNECYLSYHNPLPSDRICFSPRSFPAPFTFSTRIILDLFTIESHFILTSFLVQSRSCLQMRNSESFRADFVYTSCDGGADIRDKDADNRLQIQEFDAARTRVQNVADATATSAGIRRQIL